MPDEKLKPACCNCKYLGSPFRGELYRFHEDMECRRHSPILVGTSERPYTHFPSTSGNDWCGDYEPDTRPTAGEGK